MRLAVHVLRELALDAIKSVSSIVKSHKRRITKEQKRIAELNTLIRRIYEDNVSGKLTDKRFELLSIEYEQEQTELEQSISRLQIEQDSFHSDSARADKFIEIVKNRCA